MTSQSILLEKARLEKIEQPTAEDKRLLKMIKETLEKAEDSEDDGKEIIIHPAGYVSSSLVIEPIGNLEYIWNNDGSKGISKAEPVYEIIETEKKEKKRGRLLYYKLDIEGREAKFSDMPLKKLIYYLPDRKLMEDYVNMLYTPKTAQEIFDRQNKLVRTFLDLPLNHYYNIANLIVLESWLTEKLNAVFYGCVIGGFGGGKTISLEILKALSRHGQLAGNITSAIARLTAQQKLTIFCDELDVKNSDMKDIRDSELLMNFRQGYRRNNPYIRLNTKTFEAEFFDSFGVKVFSLKSDIEKALKNRSLVINIGETGDNRLPVNNIFKENFLKAVNDDWFFWYLENITKVRIPSISFNDIDISKPVDEIREQIWKVATNSLSPDELGFLKKFRGRNIELGFIALAVSKAYGLDILADIVKSFEEKEEYETDFEESSYQQILRDVMLSLRDEKENYAIHKAVYDEFNRIVYEKTKRNVSPFRFAELLRDFGFVDGITKKKLWIDGKSVRCLLFDSKILKRLGLAELSELSELAISNYTAGNDTSLAIPVHTASDGSVASMERDYSEES